jgi:hypothetical protein
MSTRSNIAIQKPDGKILSIYVHSDGYDTAHKHYSGKKSEMTEVQMISQIGNLLKGAGFKDEDISMQSFKSKKSMN